MAIKLKDIQNSRNFITPLDNLKLEDPGFNEAMKDEFTPGNLEIIKSNYMITVPKGIGSNRFCVMRLNGNGEPVTNEYKIKKDGIYQGNQLMFSNLQELESVYKQGSIEVNSYQQADAEFAKAFKDNLENKSQAKINDPPKVNFFDKIQNFFSSFVNGIKNSIKNYIQSKLNEWQRTVNFRQSMISPPNDVSVTQTSSLTDRLKKVQAGASANHANMNQNDANMLKAQGSSTTLKSSEITFDVKAGKPNPGASLNNEPNKTIEPERSTRPKP